MRKTLIKIKALLLLVFIMICLQTHTFAQPEEGGQPPATDAPIDGGLSILLAAGVAYGAKKGYDKRKKTTSDNM